MLNGAIGEAVGEIYVQRHFPPASKAQMQQLVENLRRAYGARIDAITWMSPETKVVAREKSSQRRRSPATRSTARPKASKRAGVFWVRESPMITALPPPSYSPALRLNGKVVQRDGYFTDLVTDDAVRWLHRLYAPALKWSLNNKRISVGIGALALLITGLMIPRHC